MWSMWKTLQFGVPVKVEVLFIRECTSCILVCCNVRRHQAPVVQKVDNAIHRINHYPLDSALGFAMTYPSFEQLGPGVLVLSPEVLLLNLVLTSVSELFRSSVRNQWWFLRLEKVPVSVSYFSNECSMWVVSR